MTCVDDSLALLGRVWCLDRGVPETSILRTYLVMMMLGSLMGVWLIVLWAGFSTTVPFDLLLTPATFVESCVVQRTT